MPIAQCARVIFVHRLFLSWLLFVTTIESKQYFIDHNNNGTIKFKTFQDFFVKLKDFKALLFGVCARGSKRSHPVCKCVTCSGLTNSKEKDNSCVSPSLGCLEEITLDLRLGIKAPRLIKTRANHPSRE